MAARPSGSSLVDELAQVPPVAARPAVCSQVPMPLTPLIGRDQDVLTVSRLLGEPEVRLLTLTGAGGVGKTRLALAVTARVAAPFPDGTCYVPLGPLADSGLVLPAIGQALGLRQRGNQAIAATLATFLRDRTALLLLDNMEHLLAAAPLIVALLEACPGVKALVTSRERLRVSGEREYPVSPLAVPDRAEPATAAELAASAPIRLFVERAAAVAPGFGLTAENAPAVAEICRRLDGLPLAIELAAARSKVLPPAAMLARLERRLPLLIGGTRDTPDRLRTMRDAIAWSYDLLTPDEQALFRALAVFAGGCSLEAAEAVAPVSGGSVLDLLTSLVDKSLLRPIHPGPRFVMLETVREFALDLLTASGDDETIRRRHAAWCLTIAEQVEAEAFAGGWESSLDRMEPEYDNLRAALGWATLRSDEESETGLRLACALWLFWLQRGHADEGRRWFARALENAEGEATALAGKAKLGMGSLVNVCGDLTGAAALGEDSLSLYQALDDQLGIARSFHLLGTTALAQGEFDRAAFCLERTVAGYAAEGGERLWLALAMAELGVARFRLGQPEPARRLLDQAAAIRDEFGAAWPASFELPRFEQLVAAAQGAPDRSEPVAAADPALRLSPRELEVLRLIATGRTNQDIADTLFISPRTVSTHAANILNKLGLVSRAEAIAFAHRHRLV